MSRRKKDPPPAKSGNWKKYEPTSGLYWRLGGPFVPVDKIPLADFKFGEIGSTYKASSRVKYLMDVIRMSQEEYDKAVAYYLKLEELGIDAMELEFYRKQDRDLEKNPGNWTMVARNVDRHRESSYRQIQMGKAKLTQYRAQLAALERTNSPLLADLDD